MVEKCPHCGREFTNAKALGSHVHYIHEADSWTHISQNRSKVEKERFEKLLDTCFSERGLRKPPQADKLEGLVKEIPEGVSDAIDRYREALRCAIRKEKLVKEFEEEFLKEADDKKNQKSE